MSTQQRNQPKKSTTINNSEIRPEECNNFNETQRQFRFSCSVEDNCSMPSLQDLLEDFDASRLEELAESLLADVTTDMEIDATGSSNPITQIESESKSMFGSMVGTKTERLEPCQDINGSLSTPTRKPKLIKQEIMGCMLPEQTVHDQQRHTSPVITPITIANTNGNNQNNNNSCSNNDNSELFQAKPTKTTNNDEIDKTLYGTYDEENNCITVVLPDEDISNFEEVIEEIVCNEEEDEYLSQVSALSPIPSNYPSPGNSSYCGTSDDVIKSPISISDRDSAYDSLLDSPHGRSLTSSVHYTEDDYHYSDIWPDSFSELFPSLA